MNFPLGPELQQGQQVQVKRTVALAVARATNLGEGQTTIGTAMPAIIAAALMVAQGLPVGEGLVVDVALMGPITCAPAPAPVLDDIDGLLLLSAVVVVLVVG
jgi:hypothetical protein